MDEETNAHYQSYIVALMSYMHQVQYDRMQVFPAEILAEVTPEHLKRWMCLKAYGLEVPRGDDRPLYWRSATLEVAKKAISWYMPNRISCWDSINKTGNPTKSRLVNDLIKLVKRAEVRRIGKPSSTKRPLTQEEFRHVLLVFFNKGDFQFRYRYCTMLKYQYHLIARCDDLGIFCTLDLHGHNNLNFSLTRL